MSFGSLYYKRLMCNTYNEPVCLEHLRASKYYSIRNKAPELPISRSIFQYCKYSLSSKLFPFVVVIFVGSSPRTVTVRSICEIESLCF